MAIVFIDSTNVEVDGVNAGDIVSVLSNYPDRKSELLKAFQAFRTVEQEANQAAIAKANEDSQKTLDDEKAKAAEALAAEVAAKQSAESAKVAAEKALQDVLTIADHPNIEAIKKQKAIDEADRQLAAAIKRKEELTKV